MKLSISRTNLFGIARIGLSRLARKSRTAPSRRGELLGGIKKILRPERDSSPRYGAEITGKTGACTPMPQGRVGLLVLTLFLFVASANAGQKVYVVSAGITGDGVFGTLDITTGAFQQIGPVEPDGYFGLARGPHESLVSLTYAGNLVSINPRTGVPTKIGPTGLAPCVVPTDPTCGPTSAFDIGGFEGRIYATDFADSIYVVNTRTGTATLLAEFSGIPPSPFVGGAQNADGTFNFGDEAIWESGGKLYATYDAWIFDPNTLSVASIVVPPDLYEIDPRTGRATVIGPTALTIGAVVDVHGIDYAFDDLTGQILKLDLATGNTTPVVSFSSTAGVIPGRPFFERPNEPPQRRQVEPRLP